MSALRWTLGWCLVFMALCAATGVALSVWYTPSTARSWPGDDAQSLSDWVRWAHRLSGLWLIAALVGCTVVAMVRVNRRDARWVVAFGVSTLGVLAAWFTGSLLDWDQIALRSVGANSRFSGVWLPAFSGDARFLIIDGAEVGQSTYRFWLLVHLGLGIVLTSVVIAALARLRLRSPSLTQ